MKSVKVSKINVDANTDAADDRKKRADGLRSALLPYENSYIKKFLLDQKVVSKKLDILMLIDAAGEAKLLAADDDMVTLSCFGWKANVGADVLRGLVKDKCVCVHDDHSVSLTPYGRNSMKTMYMICYLSSKMPKGK